MRAERDAPTANIHTVDPMLKEDQNGFQNRRLESRKMTKKCPADKMQEWKLTAQSWSHQTRKKSKETYKKHRIRQAIECHDYGSVYHN